MCVRRDTFIRQKRRTLGAGSTTRAIGQGVTVEAEEQLFATDDRPRERPRRGDDRRDRTERDLFDGSDLIDRHVRAPRRAARLELDRERIRGGGGAHGPLSDERRERNDRGALDVSRERDAYGML